MANVRSHLADPGVCTVTIDREAKRNALNRAKIDRGEKVRAFRRLAAFVGDERAARHLPA